MSLNAIASALEDAVRSMSPPLATHWENGTAEPGFPHQRVHFKAAKADHSETGRNRTELGFLQITLRFPLGAGTGDVTERAELIKETFYCGASFQAADGIVVNIPDEVEVMDGDTEADAFVVPVRIPWSAQVAR